MRTNTVGNSPRTHPGDMSARPNEQVMLPPRKINWWGVSCLFGASLMVVGVVFMLTSVFVYCASDTQANMGPLWPIGVFLLFGPPLIAVLIGMGCSLFTIFAENIFGFDDGR